jgi:hypothetical protein
VRTVHLLIAASTAVAAAVAAGTYAVGAATAASLVAGFSTEETTRHTRSVEFASTLKQAVAEHRAARAKCNPMKSPQRDACNAAIRDRERRAFGPHQS